MSQHGFPKQFCSLVADRNIEIWKMTPLSFVFIESDLFNYWHGHGTNWASVETHRCIWTNYGCKASSDFFSDCLCLPVIRQAALLLWTPSVATPQGHWCHHNRNKHGSVFLSSLTASLCSTWQSPVFWSRRSSSATSKISLTQPSRCLAGLPLSLILLLLWLTFPLLGPDLLIQNGYPFW